VNWTIALLGQILGSLCNHVGAQFVTQYISVNVGGRVLRGHGRKT
jgi:hypothetical protein